MAYVKCQKHYSEQNVFLNFVICNKSVLSSIVLTRNIIFFYYFKIVEASMLFSTFFFSVLVEPNSASVFSYFCIKVHLNWWLVCSFFLFLILFSVRKNYLLSTAFGLWVFCLFFLCVLFICLFFLWKPWTGHYFLFWKWSVSINIM